MRWARAWPTTCSAFETLGITVLLAFVLGGCSRPREIDRTGSGSTLLITNVTVVDATDAAPMENAAILVRGNRIARIGTTGEVPAPEGAQVYDGRGKYVIPGLWDMHTHVLWPPFVEDGFLRLFLVNGVTGIRDMGGTLETVQAVRPAGSLASPFNPRIVAAGPWLNEFIIDPRAGIAVETAEAAREAVASLADAGVDLIKVYSFLTRDAWVAIVEEARAQGLPVAGHVPQEVSSREASDLGMRSIEHMRSESGGFCAEVGEADCGDLLSAFQRNGTWQTPILFVRGKWVLPRAPSFAADPNLRYAPAYLREEWDEILQGRLERESFDEIRARYAPDRELAQAIHRAGLAILAGSDAGDLYSLAGFSIHDELAFLVGAGLSPRQALHAATLAPAEYLGATDSLGTIAEGKLADLVLLDANPLEDIRNTTRIWAVVRDGRLYDRGQLDSILAEIADTAGSPGR